MRELFLHRDVLPEMIPSEPTVLKFLVATRCEVNTTANVIKCQLKEFLNEDLYTQQTALLVVWLTETEMSRKDKSDAEKIE